MIKIIDLGGRYLKNKKEIVKLKNNFTILFCFKCMGV